VSFDLQPRRASPIAFYTRPTDNRSLALAEFLVITARSNAFGDPKLEAKCLYGLGLAYFFEDDPLSLHYSRTS
jgi:hypothetical protein